MPHLILDVSRNILTIRPPQELIAQVHDTAEASGLFTKGDIKVRIRAYDEFTVGNTSADFIHVFAYIMEGRNAEQKSALSKAIVSRLKSMLPDVPVISMNVMEFERATYSNRNTV